jgi:hypothetical protein
MDDATRRFLADIGRKGGQRSRRTLAPEQARAMVAAREARRRVRLGMAAGIPACLITATPAVPGCDLVAAGLADLSAGRESPPALLVSMAAPRLQQLGIPVPTPLADPEERLYLRLAAQHGDAAHGRYNALVREMVSFARAAAPCLRAATAADPCAP